MPHSNAQFENLFEYSPYAMFIHDFEKITNVNQAFLRLHGYDKKSQLVGRPALETLVHKDDIDYLKQVRDQGSGDSPVFIPKVKLIKKDGTVFTAEINLSTVLLNDKPHRLISSKDISESVKTKKILLESEKKFRNLFENSLDGIYKSTPEGKFVEVNPAMVKMLGYASADELKAIDIKTQLYFKLEDRKIMAIHEEDQYPLRRKDGSEIWVEDHSYYEYDEQGNILFHQGILRDVSIKIEKQQELENLLAVTEDQNQRLQNFAHIVSHNIRSHSSNMSSLVHFMESTNDENEKEKLFGMLKTSTEKLEKTIENLNEIITVNQNLKKPSELRSLVNEVSNTLDVLSGNLRRNEVSVTLDIPANLKVNVIPAYLDSILLNLISNGIKYRCSKKDSKLKIKAKNTKKYTVLSISDNGIGIDLEKNKDKVFGMYKTFHDHEDSRGFGLYITKNQIEAMEGKIEVESKVNEGSTFKVYFHNAN
jgi:PAS domain S-box-containing protein